MSKTGISRVFKYHSPLLISALYASVSILWIVLSDRAVAMIAGDSIAFRSFLQTIKGSVFVAATSVMLFLLIRSRLKALQDSEWRYKSLFEAAGDGVMFVGPEGIIDCNRQAVNLFGFADKKEIIGKLPEEFSPPVQATGAETKKMRLEKTKQVLAGKLEVFEWKCQKKTGEIFDVSISLSPVDAGAGTMVAILRDITELKAAQEKIRGSLREKEALLYELFHRTKNNMQVISSILELQSMSTEDQQVKSIVQDSQNRIRSMALAHEKLYMSKNLSSINIREYTNDLAHLILQSSSVSSKDAEVHINADHIITLIDIAIPCGLVLTELISNSIKYAFTPEKKGLISIDFIRKDSDRLEMIYSDNGRGMPPDFDINTTPTFGLPLMARIIKDQLHGSVKLQNSAEGTRWIISMREDIYTERV